MTTDVNIAGSDSGPEQLEAALAERLLSGSYLDREMLERAGILARQENCPLWRILPKLGYIAEAQLMQIMAETFDLPLASTEDFPAEPLFPGQISPLFLRQFLILPIGEKDGVVRIASAEPEHSYAISAAEQALGRAAQVVLAAPTEIAAALDNLYANGETAMDRLSEEDSETLRSESTEDLDALRDIASEAPVVQMVNLIIQRAVDAGASDIHFESFEQKLLVRFRVDGVLATVESPPARMRDAIVSRVKLMANLDIAERRLPQDGRLKYPVRGVPVDMRISTMPTLSGEGLVLRILDRTSVELDVGALGFDEAVVPVLDRMIRRANGIFLVAGPTGSGKTTTLYTLLERINSDDRKILTVEDPVEFQLPGIVQTQVRPGIGLDFATVLRSSLRHDPDAIMIGEIRDLETAEIAVQAALTGHTVLSTVHTNSAVGTITRLVDMGIEPYLLAATLGGIVSQRLVRKLCPDCKVETEVDTGSLLWAAGENDGEASSSSAVVWKPGGCEACRNSGYRGRTVIYEILEINDELQRALSRFDSQADIEAVARQTGMVTLRKCGLNKALAGETSLEEVMRVTIDG